MATTTPNLGLTLPSGLDPADINVLNTDMSIIDTAVGKRTVSLASSTVANSVAEAVVFAHTLTGNTAAVGNVFKIVAQGIASTTGTPALTFRLRIGGLTGALLGTISVSTGSGITSQPWWIEGNAYVVTTGASGTWLGSLQLVSSLNTTLASAVNTGIVTAAVIKDTTVNEDLVLTVQWGTASASNTITRSFGYGVREA